MLAAGQYKGAFRKLVDPESGRLRPAYVSDVNHAWYCVGDAQFKLGSFDDAIDAFRKAAKANPEDVECLIAIGNCYDELKRPKLAERTFRKALDLRSTGRTKASARVNLGNALLDQKKYQEAVEMFHPLTARRDDIGRIARANLKIAISAINKSI
jgi:Flp pilus assembly protein TadD